MQVQFPSLTFPNHFTLVTGLLPVYHGIVNNNFYDPDLGEFFIYNAGNSSDEKWWNAEPIWNTAEKAGIRTGFLFWPGSTVVINGVKPTLTIPFNASMPAIDRVERILEWAADKCHPRLLGLYLSDVDDAGHWKGPDSQELTEALKRVDFAISELITGLGKLQLLNSTDIIVVSDHGMTSQLPKNLIPLEDLIDGPISDKIVWVDYGPIASIIPKPDSISTVYEELKKSISRNKLPIKVYLKEEIPHRYHYRKSPRVPPILVECELGWGLTSRDRKWIPRGQHGYDPTNMDMKGIFLGNGLSFQTNYTIPVQSNLEVYSIIADILDIEVLPNNGTKTRTRKR